MLVGGHVVCIVGIHWLITLKERHPQNRVVGFFRAFYPMILYTALYRETELLNRLFVSGFLDQTFIALEESWFGCQPSLLFMERFPQRWVAELFYGAYFSYYFMIVGVGIALFVRGRAQFAHFLTVVSLLFYLCYLTYIFLPVIGPRVFYEDFTDLALSPEVHAMGADHPFPDSIRAGVFPSIIFLIYRHLEAAGAAFPSSHVAVAICTTFFSFLYLRRIRYFHAVMTVLLCLSTVYCRYHYVVDVLAGIVVALVIIPLINGFYWWIERRMAAERGVDAG
jgi:membrane-associated phospholipid phosphatase